MNEHRPHGTRRTRRAILWYVWLSVLLLAFLVGYVAGVSSDTSRVPVLESIQEAIDTNVSERVDGKLFTTVWEEINEHYLYKPVEVEDLFYGSIEGVVNSLDDPYSSFLNPDLTETFEEAIRGNFEGIGIELGIKDEQLVVIAPLPTTPAEEAGLQPNDIIIGIDGEDTFGIGLDEAVQRIRGDEGTQVTLRILRGEEDPFDVSVTRGVIQIDSVIWEYREDGIAYIHISHFNDTSEREFNRAVSELIIEQPLGYILDMRNNPGGYLESSVAIASHFLAYDSPVVIEEYNEGAEDVYTSTIRQPQLLSSEIVVLVNEGTASAAEIIAGALQDHERATIIGARTFGKGTVQDYRTYEDGSSLKLTVARWLTPNGRSIEENGIEPDIEVLAEIEDIEEGHDVQLEAAIGQFND